MNKTKIEWTDYSWNPVVGCKHNCWYCYGKRIAKRFFKDNPNYEPKFYPERLKEKLPNSKITESLIKTRIKKEWKRKDLYSPPKIFVCSMADLFGDWVPKKWILDIIEVANDNPQYIFQFLTKNPERYLEFRFSNNCWLGITLDYMTAKGRTDILRQMENYRFVSFEPLLSNMSSVNLSGIDLVIVGAMTGPGAIKPEKEWIASIKHSNIFFKDNIKQYL